MSLPAPSAQQLLSSYLASPPFRRQDYVKSLSRRQKNKLFKAMAKHRHSCTARTSSSNLAQTNHTSKAGLQNTYKEALKIEIEERKHALESLSVEYDELQHYFDPQETAVGLDLQEKAAEYTANGGQPLSIEVCRVYSQSLVEDIAESYQLLNSLMLHYEDLVHSRWMRMSKTQKQEVLLAAWPDMPQNHRPDIRSWISDDLDRKPKTCHAYYWPYINLEDLLLPKTLLVFLSVRARHFPAEFAYYDLDMAPLGKMGKAQLNLRKDNFTMAFLGKKSFKDYAQLVEWNDPNEQIESLHTRRTIYVDHGLQILEMQEGILSFLINCTREIVGDLLLPEISTCNFSILPESLNLSDNADGINYLHIIAREAPYRLPTRLKLARLVALISAQKRHSIEHAWALREDPSYFADAVEQRRDHRCELILDLAGRVHERAKDFPLYNKVLSRMIMDAYLMVFNWDHIAKSLHKLRDLSAKYESVIIADRDLPAELLDGFVETRYHLERVSLDLISMVKTFFFASPPLREYSYRADPNNANKSISHIKPHRAIQDHHNITLRHLLELLDFFQDKGYRELFTLHVIMDEFERFMQSDAEAKALVSPFMATLISQLAVVAECLHHLHSFQPWASKVENEIAQHREDLSDRYDARLGSWALIDLAHRSFETPKLCELGSPRDGKFYYPASERRTSANMRKMRSAEAALDKFWEAANHHWFRKTGTTPGTLIKDIIGERTLYRTPVWVEPPKIPKTIKNTSNDTGPVIPFSGHVHDVSKQFTGSFAKASILGKAKQKTHGSATEITEPAPRAADTLPSDSNPIYTVDKRAFKVFRNLFHSPDSPDQPGQVIWTDFLHAMVSVGFGAEKIHGSAWHFAPATLAAERSIQFHEPHPSNKLPITWARRYGRRLNRAFGWTAESFKLA